MITYTVYSFNKNIEIYLYLISVVFHLLSFVYLAVDSVHYSKIKQIIYILHHIRIRLKDLLCHNQDSTGALLISVRLNVIQCFH